ncbi:MAG TPA: NAD(P)H-dependent oxidoreductase [Opitutaceae bacterium]|jgi:nitroreductase
MPNPATIPAKTLTDALRWRYATKKFDATREIPAETWAALEEALLLAPSSYGLQPWKFVVVRDKATKEKLSIAAHNQRQPADCSHFVVFAGRAGLSNEDVDRFIARTAEVRGAPLESLKGYADHIKGSAEGARVSGALDIWMAKQVYIALGQFMASASLLGVDVCPMEGIDRGKFDEILGLPAKGYTTLVAGAAGYRAHDDKYAVAKKVRFRPEDVFIQV